MGGKSEVSGAIMNGEGGTGGGGGREMERQEELPFNRPCTISNYLN